MNYPEVIEQLKQMGTSHTRRIYARYGVGSKMFGVSHSNLGRLRRVIRVNHALAKRLWSSGNHDARVLATMIADPEAFDARTLDAWSKALDNYVLADAFTGIAVRSGHARRKAEQWIRSRNEWIGSVGWGMIGRLALTDVDLPDRYFEEKLELIEAQVHSGKNRVRHTMNGALISIGLRSDRLRKKAVAAARRIGPVEVDHGETACKTPDAVEYIKRSRERARRRR